MQVATAAKKAAKHLVFRPDKLYDGKCGHEVRHERHDAGKRHPFRDQQMMQNCQHYHAIEIALSPIQK
jgi:hypothetical protein